MVNGKGSNFCIGRILIGINRLSELKGRLLKSFLIFTFCGVIE